jgi:hypothetical protein
MNTNEIPIFKKSFELYKLFYALRVKIPKPDRFTIWQKCENSIIGLFVHLLAAGNLAKDAKLPSLEAMSAELNLLRIFLRLAKEVKTINNAQYVELEKNIDEIGRMLGGWIKSTKDYPAKQ